MPELLTAPAASPAETNPFQPAAGRAPRWLFTALWLVILAALTVQFAWPLAALPFHVSWNNNEGWNAYWTARALAGQPLYTDAASPISNNYPPLSFYIVGGFGRLIGDPIIAGRIICLGSLIATTLLIERIIARFGGSRWWGAAAAAVFLLIIATVAQRYLAADDPQWLAEAPMVASLLLLIGRTAEMPSRARLVAACLLMLLGGLIKHNQVALPIATTVWLAFYHRRGLAIWLVTAAVAGGAALAALALIYGHPFFDQVLHHQRIVSVKLIGGALHSVSYTLPEMLLAGLLAYSRPRDPRISLLLIFAPIAVLVGIFERLGVGVSQNAHFDGAIALTILAGIVLSCGMIGLRSVWLRLAVLAVMVAPLAARVARKAPENLREASAMKQTDARWQQAIALLARQPGAVACERPALCYWSGKPYALDVSNYGQKLRKGHDPIGLREQIARKQIGAFVELRDNRYMAGRGRLPDDFYRLMETRYRVAQVLPDDLYIVVPAD
ncbi:ArnT family glycosyltransferase [Sphingomonas crusticola]|uniref:ArnT family glycosyltransferase n=1 Tax=Sphingomonas crusticola TaxID=1697973 RepID=UPI0013C37B52|nr:glycosyltransferase family 39 protein [Sphingomonas crusticola]